MSPAACAEVPPTDLQTYLNVMHDSLASIDYIKPRNTAAHSHLEHYEEIEL